MPPKLIKLTAKKGKAMAATSAATIDFVKPWRKPAQKTRPATMTEA
jgi:hypothetical protein